VPANYVFECLELGFIFSSTDQLNAGRHSFEVTYPEVELEPPAVFSELGPHLVAEVADQLLDVPLRRGVTTKAVAESRCGTVN